MTILGAVSCHTNSERMLQSTAVLQSTAAPRKQGAWTTDAEIVLVFSGNVCAKTTDKKARVSSFLPAALSALLHRSLVSSSRRRFGDRVDGLLRFACTDSHGAFAWTSISCSSLALQEPVPTSPAVLPQVVNGVCPASCRQGALGPLLWPSWLWSDARGTLCSHGRVARVRLATSQVGVPPGFSRVVTRARVISCLYAFGALYFFVEFRGPLPLSATHTRVPELD